MTDQLPVLHSRQTNIPTPNPQPVGQSLSEIERICNMIASGGDMVPPAYRGKPGAVLLAKLWADKNGIDLLTAVQNVYPIQGKPYVAAEMRVELASIKGYEIEVVESTGRRCELEVTSPKGRVRRVVAAMPDQPEETGEGLIFVRPAPEDLRKPTWKERTSDMLYALACRIADRRLVRSGAALLDTVADEPAPSDPLDVLVAAQEPTAELEPVEGIVTVEEIDEPAPEPAGEQVADDSDREEFLLNAATAGGVKRPRVELLRLAQRLGHQVGTIADLVADADAYDAVLDHIQAE